MERRRASLNVLKIKEPCRADWNEMTGNERSRFCTHCSKSVINLSALPTDEAERLICESGGRLCVRYDPAADGTPQTLDYHAPTRIRSWRFWSLFGLSGGIACLIGNSLFGRPTLTPPSSSTVVTPMGKIATSQPAVMGLVCPPTARNGASTQPARTPPPSMGEALPTPIAPTTLPTHHKFRGPHGGV